MSELTTLELTADEKETLTFWLRRNFEGARSIGSSLTELSSWERGELRKVLTKLQGRPAYIARKSIPPPPPRPKFSGKPRARK
jgi:hypothetical protein